MTVRLRFRGSLLQSWAFENLMNLNSCWDCLLVSKDRSWKKAVAISTFIIFSILSVHMSSQSYLHPIFRFFHWVKFHSRILSLCLRVSYTIIFRRTLLIFF